MTRVQRENLAASTSLLVVRRSIITNASQRLNGRCQLCGQRHQTSACPNKCAWMRGRAGKGGNAIFLELTTPAGTASGQRKTWSSPTDFATSTILPADPAPLPPPPPQPQVSLNHQPHSSHIAPTATTNRCLLPCAFTVAGIALHEGEFAGQRCKLGSVTRGWDLLAEASRLPPEVASLDIMERHKWAFAGRRVPNFVRLLADLGPP